MSSPTQRTLQLLRRHGYLAAVAEKWNPHSRPAPTCSASPTCWPSRRPARATTPRGCGRRRPSPRCGRGWRPAAPPEGPPGGGARGQPPAVADPTVFAGRGSPGRQRPPLCRPSLPLRARVTRRRHPVSPRQSGWLPPAAVAREHDLAGRVARRGRPARPAYRRPRPARRPVPAPGSRPRPGGRPQARLPPSRPCGGPGRCRRARRQYAFTGRGGQPFGSEPGPTGSGRPPPAEGQRQPRRCVGVSDLCTLRPQRPLPRRPLPARPAASP